jgi:hypothetical protein
MFYKSLITKINLGCILHGIFKGICKTMQCHYIYILKKVKKISLEILANGKKDNFFCVLLQILLLIKKIKAKSLIGESKYMCRYCKIIWILNPKCNNHIEVCFKITHRWFRQTLNENLTLNAIPICMVVWKYPICNLDAIGWRARPKCNTCIQVHSKIIHRWFKQTLGKDLIVNAIPTCKVISK